jgi:hypothetical protein
MASDLSFFFRRHGEIKEQFSQRRDRVIDISVNIFDQPSNPDTFSFQVCIHTGHAQLRANISRRPPFIQLRSRPASDSSIQYEHAPRRKLVLVVVVCN